MRLIQRVGVFVAFVISLTSSELLAEVITVTPFGGNWQDIYNGFAVQESFEDTTLAPGLSITLEGGAFVSPETHATLPATLDPTTITVAFSGGPFNNNTWDGTFIVTNYGHDATMPVGSRWINDWGPAVLDLAESIAFNIAGPGAAEFGIGLSNFQSLGGPSELTDHELFINGVSQGTIESIGGSNLTPGIDVRNGYLSIIAMSNPITSVKISPLGGVGLDGMNFDALGFTLAETSAVPEPSTLALWSLGAVALVGVGWRRRAA